MVPSEAQENGQKESKRSEQEEEEEDDDDGAESKERVSPEEKMDTSFQVAIGMESPTPGLDADMKTGEKKIEQISYCTVLPLKMLMCSDRFQTENGKSGKSPGSH